MTKFKALSDYMFESMKNPKGVHQLELDFKSEDDAENFYRKFRENIKASNDDSKTPDTVHRNWEVTEGYNPKSKEFETVIRHTENNEDEIVFYCGWGVRPTIIFTPVLKRNISKCPDEEKGRLHISRLAEQVMKYHNLYKSCRLTYSSL